VPTRGRISGRPATVAWVPERFPPDQPFNVLDYLTFMGAAVAAVTVHAVAWSAVMVTGYVRIRRLRV
jgi:hypothetical protein